MTLRKTLKISSALFFLAVFLVGCADLTETMITDTVASEQFSTAEGIDEALIGAYHPLRGFWGREQAMLMTQYGTDLYTIGQSYNPWWDTYGGGLSPEVRRQTNNADLVWDGFYRGINNANTVIDRSNEIDDLDADFRNSKQAEARFLRASYYFVLVQHFGGVHITTEETRSVELEANRASEKDVYDLIIDDLTFAIEHLPDKQTDYGRAERYAAVHLLSKVHLTIGNWAQAANLAIDVIDNGPYRLLDNYSDVFDPFNQRHDEVIFAVSWGPDTEANSPVNELQRFFGPREWLLDGLKGDDMYGIGIARFRPTEYSLTEIYGSDYRKGGVNIQNDVRYHVTFREDWPYNDPSKMPSCGVEGETGGLFTVDPIINDMSDEEIAQMEEDNCIQKILRLDQWNTTYYSANVKHRYPGNRAPWRHDRDFMLMRLGETYLIAAEALMMDNRSGEAVQYFNEVRRRAEAPGETIPLITSSELNIDEILDERARELGGELHRWTDLKRTGKLLERARIGNPNAAPNIQEYHMLRPIPQHQIDRTKNDYPQNPGYQ